MMVCSNSLLEHTIIFSIINILLLQSFLVLIAKEVIICLFCKMSFDVLHRQLIQT